MVKVKGAIVGVSGVYWQLAGTVGTAGAKRGIGTLGAPRGCRGPFWEHQGCRGFRGVIGAGRDYRYSGPKGIWEHQGAPRGCRGLVRGHQGV